MSGAATGQIAADVSFARPSSIPADMIIGYCGAALPDIATIQAWGKPFVLGFESATTRSYAGFDAGVADAQYFLQRAASIGYPDSCSVWVCAADASSTPSFYWANITQYFAGWRSVIGPSRKMWGYGNVDAVSAAVAGGANIEWGVGTWGYGEGSSAYQMPAGSTADILQSGNTPGPAEGTDYNALYAPLSLFDALGGPSSPPDSPKELPTMLIGLKSRVSVGGAPNEFDAFLVDGGVITHTFDGGYQAWGFIVTQSSAVNFHDTTGTPSFQFNATEWLVIESRTKNTALPPSSTTLTDAQLASLATAIAAKIPVPPTHLSGTLS